MACSILDLFYLESQSTTVDPGLSSTIRLDAKLAPPQESARSTTTTTTTSTTNEVRAA